jgi:hypothetical protein
MKIVSKFKDYYDYISHQYGADPLYTYDRKPFGDYKYGIHHVLMNGTNDQYFRLDIGRRYYEDANLIILIAGNYIFKFLRSFNKTKDSIVTTNSLVGYGNTSILGISNETRIKLIKLVGVPVFLIEDLKVDYRTGYPVLHISERIPILKDYGISAIVSATDMWQSIFYTLSNVLQPNIDKQPPKEVNNYEKILAHGFDPKISFRHRKL